MILDAGSFLGRGLEQVEQNVSVLDFGAVLMAIGVEDVLVARADRGCHLIQARNAAAVLVLTDRLSVDPMLLERVPRLPSHLVELGDELTVNLGHVGSGGMQVCRVYALGNSLSFPLALDGRQGSMSGWRFQSGPAEGRLGQEAETANELGQLAVCGAALFDAGNRCP